MDGSSSGSRAHSEILWRSAEVGGFVLFYISIPALYALLVRGDSLDRLLFRILMASVFLAFFVGLGLMTHAEKRARGWRA